jgi:hypothetical protein
MTKERESNENIEELREESPYKFSICDRAFSDRAELYPQNLVNSIAASVLR